MTMHDPPHPGGVIRRQSLDPLGLTVTAAAAWLGVTRGALSEVLNGRAGISPEMGLRLEAAGWGSAQMWLGMQRAYDLWQTQQSVGPRILKTVKRYPVPVSA